MLRTLGVLTLGGLLCAGASLGRADDSNSQIPGGIEGKVKMVDVENGKLTITTQGRDRTFTITDETMMVGPRGGKVRRHLKDPRFHEGFPVTVVAQGDKAAEVHLGSARQSDARPSDEGKPAAPARTGRTQRRLPAAPDATPESRVSKKVSPTTSEPKPGLKGKEAQKLEEDDEAEIPGKIKSFDARRRLLVVTLLNGKNRSFMLAKDVPVHVKGATSRRGLADPALKVGAPITVITDEGGRKVKELQFSQPALKKAG
jgi:hypothetical protein